MLVKGSPLWARQSDEISQIVKTRGFVFILGKKRQQRPIQTETGKISKLLAWILGFMLRGLIDDVFGLVTLFHPGLQKQPHIY